MTTKVLNASELRKIVKEEIALSHVPDILDKHLLQCEVAAKDGYTGHSFTIRPETDSGVFLDNENHIRLHQLAVQRHLEAYGFDYKITYCGEGTLTLMTIEVSW